MTLHIASHSKSQPSCDIDGDRSRGVASPHEFLVTTTVLVIVVGAMSSLLLGVDAQSTLMVALGLIVLLLVLLHPQRSVVLAFAVGVVLPFAAPLAIPLGPGAIAVADVAAILLAAVLATEHRHIGGRLGVPWRLWIIAPYFAAVLVTLVVIPMEGSIAVALVNRLLLTIPWLVAGYYAASRPAVIRAFAVGFVAASVVLSLAWFAQPGSSLVFNVQKNPAGGRFAIATLILLLHGRGWSLLLATIPAGGVIVSGSRGALLSLAAALLIYVVLRPTVRNLVVVLASPLFAVGALAFLPLSMTERLLSRNESGSYNAQIRLTFVEDALYQTQGAEWFGRGIGTYIQFDSRLQRVVANDPHNVYVLTFYEGGWVLVAGFIAMTVVPLLVAWHHRRLWQARAFMVLYTALLAHSAVEIFWVRGKLGIFMASWGVLAYTLTWRQDNTRGLTAVSDGTSN